MMAANPAPGPTRLIPPPPTTRGGRRLARIAASGGSRVDRFNRVLFVVVGLVLAVAGVGGLLLGGGTLHGTTPGKFYAQRAADAADSQDLAAAIAMAVCLVLFLAGLRWAFAQLRPVSDGERLGTLRLFRGPKGRTTIAATTVAKAAAADVANRPGITSAKVRLRALQPTTRVTMAVEVGLDADPGAVLGQLEGALSGLLGALGSKESEADAEIRMRFARGARAARSPRGDRSPRRSDRPARVQ